MSRRTNKEIERSIYPVSYTLLDVYKRQAYELVDHTTQEEQAREEVGRLAEYFQQEGSSSESDPQEAVVGNKIESSMQRYEENNRLLANFYGSDPYDCLLYTSRCV